MSPCFTACVTKVTKAGTCALWPNSIRSTPHHLRLEMAAMKTLQTPLWQTSFAAKKSTKGMSISQSRCSVNEASHFPREKKCCDWASRFRKVDQDVLRNVFKKIAHCSQSPDMFQPENGPFVVLSESQSLAGFSPTNRKPRHLHLVAKHASQGPGAAHLEKFQASRWQ